jgi:hypothetical protein
MRTSQLWSRGAPLDRMLSLTAAADADDRTWGCDSAAKLNAGQAWRGRHGWLNGITVPWIRPPGELSAKRLINSIVSPHRPREVAA